MSTKVSEGNAEKADDMNLLITNPTLSVEAGQVLGWGGYEYFKDDPLVSRVTQTQQHVL